jgi:hypothetical protein
MIRAFDAGVSFGLSSPPFDVPRDQEILTAFTQEKGPAKSQCINESLLLNDCYMKSLFGLLVFMLSTVGLAHPGGGIIALSENSAIIADSVENFIWLVEKGEEPKRLVSKFHGHWLTRGFDGNLYAEAFQESGGAWSSAAFRLELPTARLTEIAHRDQLGVLVFAVDRDGSLVFQRRGSLVSRRNGKESPFRSSANEPKLEEVTAYAWSREGDLVFADRNRIRRTDSKGVTSLIAEIEGKVLEPKIWNATDTPSVFGLAVDNAGSVLAAVPGLAKVYRIEKDHPLREIARGEDGWRATGVAVFGDSIFLLESDSRASTSPRVRILRGNGTIELLTIPHRSK